MKVIFLQNIKGVAQMGDIKDVSDGYARNFLLPRKLAKAASAQSIKEAELLRQKREIVDATRKERGERLVKDLEGLELEFIEDSNDDGHLYGSVHAEQIAEALNKKGFKVTEDEINLPQPLKTVGEHEVEVEPYKDLKVNVKLKIVRSAS